VVLAESQGKKAAFLQEVVRTLGLNAKVHAQRAEQLQLRFDCVSLRAVDRMESAVRAASLLVAPGGFLALMTTQAETAGLTVAAGAGFEWAPAISLAGSSERLVVIGRSTVG
jgi:16S rRNA (guanine527-N7)-methyltransferase